MSLRPLMVLGCSSNAGKSLLVTALIRWLAREGVDVVPFKAQNMSNNARVVEGGEIGVAQWLQARAGGVEPTVDMNPVLVKPEADTRSQVVVAGRARQDLMGIPWEERGAHLWPAIESAYHRLSSRHDLLVIEGAGSPAEVNLEDLVNNRVLDLSDAAGVLVVDIDRGGAFAHLYGTWALVPQSTRRRLRGFVLNKFRGDAGLLEPGPSEVTRLTSMAAIGVLPMLDHDLPDEEGATLRHRSPDDAISVAVVRWPYASNLDELQLLSYAARVHWATRPSDIESADLVILPGSKHVASDVRWLRDRGLDDAIEAHAARGGRLLGICGGAMALGDEIADPIGVEGEAEGLGLIPVSTTMAPDKVTTRATVTFSGLADPWESLNGEVADGYEIRNGRVEGNTVQIAPYLWGRGPILATTVHGLLESPSVLEALTGQEPAPVLDQTFDRLADAVDAHLDGGFLRELAGM